MTRAELEHAIRAACGVSNDEEVWVFGSQAILGEHPEAPESLRRSIEADVAPKNFPERVDLIDGALGELSPFHRAFGFYVHGVPIESATLPAGWEDRAIPVSGWGDRPATGLCVEGHDLASSKLVAFREKDREFVRILLREGMVRTDVLLARIESLSIDEKRREDLVLWVRAVSAPPGPSAPLAGD